ncbi:HEAT repeat domain-containing protein [Tolypothrix sp. FACHB-123]|uniref:HEAT repeat domain-containing protein n=1 Tax=Tolypothrix sp. FACHB-123 TaxID=2692868 RepID=UPI001F54BB13|nr:HEAT repeat domain-containing protein [Tolypothrix sp. FACHB-123]
MVKILNSNGDIAGSGFVIRADGYIITCHHVIYWLDALNVEYQGQEYEAKWCENLSNIEVDVAILKINIEDAKAVLLISSQHLSTSVKVYGFPPTKKNNFPEGYDVFARSIRSSAPINTVSTYKNRETKFHNIWNRLPQENSYFLSHRIDAKVESGSSGGAVLAEDLGGVVGVIQCSKNDESYVIRWDNILDKLDVLGLEPDKNAVCSFLEDIEENFKYIKLFHTQEKILLKELYIPIKVTLETNWAYKEGDKEFKRLYAMKGFDEEGKRVVLDWKEVKKEHQKMIVLADPGMGKSTLLKMEAGLIAREEREKLLKHLSLNSSHAGGIKQDINWGIKSKLSINHVIFPLFLRLSDLDEAEGEIIDTIPQIVKRDYPKTAKYVKQLLEDKLNNSKCILLLDGLDEVPIEHRNCLKEKLNRFVRNYSCPIICTSRIVGYGGAFIDGAKDVEIMPLIQKQTEEYIRIWFNNAVGNIEDKSVSAEDLIKELQQKPQIRGLAQNPLILSLLCSLYQTKGVVLPARRGLVYEKAVDYMLNQWKNDNNRLSLKNIGIIAKKKLLAVLAYEFSHEGKEIFSRDELHHKIELYLNKQENRDFRNYTTEELIKELTEEDGIIQKLSPKVEQYLFLHRTFQEYFTAYYLNQAIKNNSTDGINLAKKIFWEYDLHETLTLLASFMENPMLLIQALVNEKDDIFRTQLLLAGRCIAEVQQNGKYYLGINQNSEVIAKTIKKIYKFWRRYPNANFVKSVVVALGKVNSQMCQILITALKNFDSQVIVDAAEVLSKIGTPESVQALIAALKDSDSEVRRNAASALGNIGTPESVQALIAALKDSDSGIRHNAASALGNIGTPESVQALIAALKDSDSGIRRNAASALGNIGTPESVQALIAALKDSDSGIRRNAASALGNIGTPESVQALIAALKDSDSEVRRNAASALGNTGTPESVQVLIAALKDSDSEVRRNAASALGNTGTPEVVSVLVALLKDSDSEIRARAASALGKIGTPESVQALIAALKYSDSYVWFHVAETLGEIRARDAVQPLIAALKYPDLYMRREAVRALGRIGTPEAALALTTTLDDLSWKVRVNTRRWLEEVGDVKTLEKIIRLPEIDIYEYSIFTLARILAVRFSKQKEPFIPVYPELVKFNPVWVFVKQKLQRCKIRLCIAIEKFRSLRDN